MLNFDTKKRLLKNLRQCSEKNILMVVPCVIASWFVRLFYFIACNIDIALSDKNGNFLGIKHKDKAERTAKKDDIVYVKRPFFGRVVSVVLTLAFICTFIPVFDVEVFAAEIEYRPFNDGTDCYYAVVGGVSPVNPDNFRAPYDLSYISGSGAVKLMWYDGNANNNFVSGDNSNKSEFQIKYRSVLDNSSLKTVKATERNNNAQYSYVLDTNIESGIEYYISITPITYVSAYKLDENGKYYQVDTRRIEDDARTVYFNNGSPILPYAQLATSPEITVTYIEGNGDNANDRTEIKVNYIPPDATGCVLYQTYYPKNNGSVTEKIIKTFSYNNNNGVNPIKEGDTLIVEDILGKRLQDTSVFGFRLVAFKNVFEDKTAYKVGNKAYITSPNTENEQIKTKTGMPTGFSAARENDTTIKLTWNKVTDADGYRIFRMTQDEYIAKNVNNVIDNKLYEFRQDEHLGDVTDLSKATFSDSKVDNNVKYYYFVEAYRNYPGEVKYSKYNICSYQLETKVNTPNITKTEPGNGEITITWEYKDPSDGAKGFDILRTVTDMDGNPILDDQGNPQTYEQSYEVSTTKSPFTFKDTGLKNGMIYTYKVRAYKYVNGVKEPIGTYSSPSAPTRVGLPIIPPNDITVTVMDNEIDISWVGVPNAKYYKLYIEKKTGEDTWETVQGSPFECHDTKFKHTGLLNGEVYRYSIESYNGYYDANGKPDHSEKSNPPREARVGLDLGSVDPITVKSTDGQVELKWQKIKNADYYVIYASPNGEYNKDDPKAVTLRTTDEKYTHIGLENKSTWTYYIIPYKKCPSIYGDGEVTPGVKSEVVKAIVGITIGTPTDFIATPDDGMIALSWKSVQNAQKYYIDALNLTTGETANFETSQTSYKHTKLKNGDTWQYTIKAYKETRSENGVVNKVYSEVPAKTSATVGVVLMQVADLNAVAGESEIVVSWTAVKGATGYTLYASDGFTTITFDVTKTKFTHTGLNAGVTWSYYVVPYKSVDGQKVTGPQSKTVSATVSKYLTTPKDFTVTTQDASAVLKWSAVKGAEGYVVTAYKSGSSFEFDVSKTGYTHTGLVNGDTWNYYVRAYRTVNGVRVYSDPTITLSVKIGASLPAPIDLIATSGNRQIDLSWSAIKGAEGYVIYLYDEGSMTFLPLAVVSKTKYSHTGLQNGRKYTYMVAAYKTISGERVYGDYSMAVEAIPSAGSAADLDTLINIKGTAPYGISHSELISAVANHEAFDEPIDCYFTTNEESTNAIKEVLRHYANGLSSFIVYPFDISLYLADTLIAVEPNPGFSITFTMPIPDRLVPYRDYITVVHLPTDGTEIINDRDYDNEDGVFIDSSDLEVLPSAVIQVNGRWCIQFSSSSVSPFALVIYKDAIDDISSSDAGAAGGTFAGNFDTGLLLFTALPDIMPSEKKTKFVVSSKKYYRIKK